LINDLEHGAGIRGSPDRAPVWSARATTAGDAAMPNATNHTMKRRGYRMGKPMTDVRLWDTPG
jgi:hypothetical protein